MPINLNEKFDELCGLCGTDHSDPDIEWDCVEGQAESQSDDEPADCDDDRGMNPYDGTYDYDEYNDYRYSDEPDFW